MVKKITGAEFESVKKQGVSVVDFSAKWCGPCQMLAPILEEISEEMQGKAYFYNVDVDQDAALASQYGITNIPALLVLKDGVKQDILVGFRPKEPLMEALAQYI